MKTALRQVILLGLLAAVIGIGLLAITGDGPASVEAAIPTGLDHYLGYDITTDKTTPFTPLTVSLTDEFETGNFNVTKALRLYNPVKKTVAGQVYELLDADTHLKSYAIVSTNPAYVRPSMTGLLVINQFGYFKINTGSPSVLMVPTSKSLTGYLPASDPALHDVDHFKCYAASTTDI